MMYRPKLLRTLVHCVAVCVAVEIISLSSFCFALESPFEAIVSKSVTPTRGSTKSRRREPILDSSFSNTVGIIPSSLYEARDYDSIASWSCASVSLIEAEVPLIASSSLGGA